MIVVIAVSVVLSILAITKSSPSDHVYPDGARAILSPAFQFAAGALATLILFLSVA